MVEALFDTNILIDHLRGNPLAEAELARYHKPAISVVTWMEVLVGAAPDVETQTRLFLDGFTLIELDDAVASAAVQLRRQYRLKLFDAVIWASARVHGRLLVTRDVKDFPRDDPGLRVPY